MVQVFQCSAGLLRAQRALAALVVGVSAIGAAAQAQSIEAPRNVINMSASGTVEVEQDWLQMRLAASHDGTSAAAVQKQLQQSVDAALRAIQPQVQGQQLQVHTSSFGVYPRQDSDGKIRGWSGRAELVLEGKDFARITQAVTQAPSMVVSHMAFSVSKEGAAKVTAEATAKAVDEFRAKAQLQAQMWGFTSYTLREVHMSYDDGHYAPRIQSMMTRSAEMNDSAAPPVPVQAGKSQVIVMITGSVQLQ